MRTEIWRPIKGLEGRYDVSDRGVVRSLDQLVSNGRSMRPVRGRTLKPALQPCGYYTVRIGGRTRYIHRLVAEAFIGPRLDELYVCHNNGDPLDNRAENLRYGTNSDNQIDAVAHGVNKQALKTECPAGHPYDATNTWVRVKPGRRPARECRTCHRERARRARIAS